MPAVDEDLRQSDRFLDLRLVQLFEVRLVHVDISLVHLQSQVTEYLQDTSAVLDGFSDAAHGRRVDHDGVLRFAVCIILENKTS